MAKARNPDLKIIVVDDSDFSRNSVVAMLESEGFSVVGSANTAEKAIELYSTTSANLFIIDVVMPGVSGIEAAKFISEKNSDVFIIMMSSLNTENAIIESITTGAVDYLQKPFSQEVLISAVEKIEFRIRDD